MSGPTEQGWEDSLLLLLTRDQDLRLASAARDGTADVGDSAALGRGTGEAHRAFERSRTDALNTLSTIVGVTRTLTLEMLTPRCSQS